MQLKKNRRKPINKSTNKVQTRKDTRTQEPKAGNTQQENGDGDAGTQGQNRTDERTERARGR